MGGHGSHHLTKIADVEEIRRQTGFSSSSIIRLHHRFQALDKEGKGYLSKENFLCIGELAVNPLADRIIGAFFGDGADLFQVQNPLNGNKNLGNSTHRKEQKKIKMDGRIGANRVPWRVETITSKYSKLTKSQSSNTDNSNDLETRKNRDTVDFPAFIKVLAYFRPINEDKPKEPGDLEPINSRGNKLKFAFQLYDQDRDGKISRDEMMEVLRMMVGVEVTNEQLESITDRTIQEADLDGDNAISFQEFTKSLEKMSIEQKMSIRFLK